VSGGRYAGAARVRDYSLSEGLFRSASVTRQNAPSLTATRELARLEIGRTAAGVGGGISPFGAQLPIKREEEEVI
jgi:hypothetical protein